MNFNLYKLSDAFRDVKYIKNNSRFKLFAFLLATPADRNIFPELLIHFDEINKLTGEEILVIAPSIRIGINTERYGTFETREATRDEVLEIFRTGMWPQYFGFEQEKRIDVSKMVSEYLKNQTEQTYELLSFLELKRDCLPAIIFFEKLTKPTEFILWELHSESADEVLRELRGVVERLRNKCHWGIERRINEITSKLQDGAYGNSWHNDWEIERLESHIIVSMKIRELFASLKDLRDTMEKLKNKSGINMPFASAQENIGSLCRSPLDPTLIHYLRRHRRRWKNRMPTNYLSAIERFLKATENLGPQNVQDLDSPNVEDLTRALDKDIKDTEQILEEKKRKTRDEKEAAKRELQEKLKTLEEVATTQPSTPLVVLRSLHRFRMIKMKLEKLGKLTSEFSFVRELFLG